MRGLLASLTLPEGRIRTREFQGEIDGNRIAVAVTAERLDEGSILIVFQDRLDFRRTDDNRPFLRETDEDPDNDYVRDLEEQLDLRPADDQDDGGGIGDIQ